MSALLLIVTCLLGQEQELVLVVPEIRKMTEFESNFSQGILDKTKLDKLEKFEFPGGVAYISISEDARQVLLRRNRLLKGLSDKIDSSGSLKFSDLDSDTKKDIYQGIWGAEASDTKYDLPLKMDVMYKFDFEVQGKKVQAQTSKPWQPEKTSGEPLRESGNLINVPKNTPQVNYSPPKSSEKPVEGLQYILVGRSYRDTLFKNQILLEAQKAYFQIRADEYKRNGDLINSLFGKLTTAEENESIGGKPVPSSIIKDLASRLRHDFPSEYPNMDSALAAARQANCLGGYREVDLCARHLFEGTNATSRYRLTYRPYNP